MVVTDPDNLDRNQVIYSTDDQKISIYPVGAVIHASANGTNGVTTVATKQFSSAGALFQTTWGVQPGDILMIENGLEAGHYVIDTIDSETQLTLLMAANFTTGDTTHVFDTREPTGGSVADGVTEQAQYSFTKEEWRTDSETVGTDDLIRHEFPYIMITSEQAEIGGSTAQGGWNYFEGGTDTVYTRKKIRTGGWEALTAGGSQVDLNMGIISLGPMDADSAPYYQQTSAITAPVNFNFLGPVNEAVDITGLTTYFKGFLRKKYKSYASYDLLTEQGIAALVSRLYSFPLSHLADSAIVAYDAAIEGSTPWTNFSVVSNDTDGITTVSTGTFTNTGATDFDAAGVIAGDILYISSGADAGYYTITNVATVTITVEINNSDFTTFAGDTAQTFAIHTNDILIGLTDGVLTDVDSDTGTVASSTGGFTSAGIVADDLVIVIEPAEDARGIYKVISNDTDNQLTVDTSDVADFTGQTAIDFDVVEPGMYLQYKQETVTISGTTTLAFADDDPDTITRAAGDWGADGVVAGTVITISGSASNDGVYTCAIPGTTIMTLVATDTLVVEGAVAATATAYNGFLRTINSVVYSFHWRLLGNSGTLDQCYQYAQYQLRESTDIDWGAAIARGDITDSLMSYSFPTATTQDMYIDDLSSADVNNVTFVDATGASRTEKFLAAGSIGFNANLENDAGPSKYWMFFLNDDAPGDNTGADYGTPLAIIVQDSTATPINGNVSGPSVGFDYDYDNNQQRGSGAAGTDAPVVVIGIGLITAQFVRTDYTLTRDKANNISLVGALERNYSNP